MKAKYVRRLEEIIHKIEEEPLRLRMESWGWMVPKDQIDNKDKENKDVPHCGTVGCIAGWAVLMYEPGAKKLLKERVQEAQSEQDFDDVFRALFDSDIPTRAEELLGLTAMQATTLFFHEQWPKGFGTKYNEAKTPKQRAKITIARIRHLIKTGE